MPRILFETLPNDDQFRVIIIIKMEKKLQHIIFYSRTAGTLIHFICDVHMIILSCCSQRYHVKKWTVRINASELFKRLPLNKLKKLVYMVILEFTNLFSITIFVDVEYNVYEIFNTYNNTYYA